LDEASGGAVTRAIFAAPRFNGKKDELLPIVGPANLSVSRILLAGLGKPASLDSRSLQELGGNLVAHLNRAAATETIFAIEVAEGSPVGDAEAAAGLAFGAQLRSYRFDKYKTKEKPEKKPSLANITVMTAAAPAARRAFRPLEKTAEAVFFTRDLVSEPANVIYPETLAGQAKQLAELGVGVEILDENELRALGMHALLAVGQGSVRPPRVVVMKWRGAKTADNREPGGPLAFVGKGVTFDTGG